MGLQEARFSYHLSKMKMGRMKKNLGMAKAHDQEMNKLGQIFLQNVQTSTSSKNGQMEKKRP